MNETLYNVIKIKMTFWFY